MAYELIDRVSSKSLSFHIFKRSFTGMNGIDMYHTVYLYGIHDELSYVSGIHLPHEMLLHERDARLFIINYIENVLIPNLMNILSEQQFSDNNSAVSVIEI